MLDYRPNIPADRPSNRLAVSRLTRATRRMLATDGGFLDVKIFGPSAPRAIILITHGLGSLESFEDIAEGLSARFPGRQIIAYSRPGRGHSPEPDGIPAESLLWHEASQALPALMRALSVPSADLVAHSDGVAVAMLLAGAKPWMVNRIIAISAQVHAAADPETDALDCRSDMDRLCADHADPGRAIRCFGANRAALAAHADQVLAHVSALHAPLLLIQGLKDNLGAEQQMAAISARVQGPMQWVMLRQDGHFPQHDHTDVVLDLIAGHVQDPAGASPSLAAAGA